jgi:hypothetical protein
MDFLVFSSDFPWLRRIIAVFCFSYLDGLGPLDCPHSELPRNYESYRHLVGLLARGISQSEGCYLHKTTQTEKKNISMPQVTFEHTRPVFERAKTFSALDREADVTFQMDKIITYWSFSTKSYLILHNGYSRISVIK